MLGVVLLNRSDRILINDISLNMFTNICRGLFEKDKLLYAFMIAVGILRQTGKVGCDPSTSRTHRYHNCYYFRKIITIKLLAFPFV